MLKQFNNKKKYHNISFITIFFSCFSFITLGEKKIFHSKEKMSNKLSYANIEFKKDAGNAGRL